MDCSNVQTTKPPTRIFPVQQASYEESTPGRFHHFINPDVIKPSITEETYPLYLVVSSTKADMKQFYESNNHLPNDLDHEENDHVSLKLVFLFISKEDRDSKTVPTSILMARDQCATKFIEWFLKTSSSGFKFYWSFTGHCSTSLDRKPERLDIPFQEAVNLLPTIGKHDTF